MPLTNLILLIFILCHVILSNHVQKWFEGTFIHNIYYGLNVGELVFHLGIFPEIPTESNKICYKTQEPSVKETLVSNS